MHSTLSNFTLNVPVRKLTTLVAFSFILFHSANAQIDFTKFEMDSFRLPDIYRKTLSGSGSFLGQYSESKHEQHLTTQNRSIFSPTLRLSFNQFKNNYSLQATRSVLFETNFRNDQEKSINSGKEVNTNFRTSLSYSTDRKRYKGNSFFETGISSFFLYDYDRLKVSDSISFDNRDKSYRISVSPRIGFGKGRLEPVSDVTMAMFVLKDVEALGVDLSTLTTEDIYSFASLMSDVQYRRVLDSRRQRIMELRELYNFMVDKGWTIQDDPGFFTVLTDNWIYNDPFGRLTGSRWRFLINPEITYSIDHILPGFETQYTEEALNLIIEFRKHQPVNLYRQHTRRHTLTLAVGNNERQNIIYGPLGTYGHALLENSIGRSWYPNNRTSITATIGIDYSYFHFFEPSFFLPEENQHVVEAGTNISGEYFLSYRTRFVFSGELQYGYSTGGALVGITDVLASSLPVSGFHGRINGSVIVDLF